MIRHCSLCVLLALAVVGFGCGGPSLNVGWPPEPSEPGLQVFPSARDFDGPGQIISIDRKHVWSPELDISKQLSVSPPSVEEFPNVFVSRDRRAALLFGMLGTTNSVGAVDTMKVEFVMRLTNGARERVQGQQVDSVLKGVLPTFHFAEGLEYYIITETVRADSVDFEISRRSIASIGGKVTIKKLIDVDPSLATRDTSATSLVRRFSKPLRVFYKVRLLSRGTKGLNGGQFPEAKSIEVKQSLDVVAEDTTKRKRPQ